MDCTVSKMMFLRRFLREHPLLDVQLSVARARLREVTSFRADFLAGTLAVFAQQAIVLIFLAIMFRHATKIGGYDFSATLLLFGLAMTVQSLSHILFEGLHILGPKHIERGEFDLMLIRPGHPLLHILSGFFQISGILPFLLGTGITVYALFLASQVFFPIALCILPVFIISGVSILGGILLSVSSLAFLFKRVRAIRGMMLTFEDTMVYPLDIFPKGFRHLLLSVLPFGWAAFGPSQYFLTGNVVWLVASMTAGLLAGFLGVSMFTFLARSYESTGT